MSITLPSNARGPVLDLTLPESDPAVDLILRNKTTGKSLALNLPEELDGDDLSLDFRLRTITDQTGADRSALLDPEDNELWTPEPLIAGANDIAIEAVGGSLVAKDGFNQTEGNATGKKLEAGGEWKGDGDADDFKVVSGSHTLRRTAVSDAGYSEGRRIWASAPSVAAVRAQVDLAVENPSKDLLLLGIFCRRVASGARLDAVLQYTSAPGAEKLYAFLLLKEATKTVTILGETLLSNSLYEAFQAGQTLTAMVECVGANAKGWFGLKGELTPTSTPTVTGTHPWLNGKETNLSTGAIGIVDSHVLANAATRTFDRFRAYDLAGKGGYAAKAALRWEKGYY